jgi:hypothetical protein
VGIIHQLIPEDRVYAYQADKVVETGKDLLQHLERRLSSDDYARSQKFATELMGYIKEADDDRRTLEQKLAGLESDVLNLREARNLALVWLAVFLLYQAYETGRYFALAGVGVLLYLSFKVYEYYERRQNKKLAERAARRP